MKICKKYNNFDKELFSLLKESILIIIQKEKKLKLRIPLFFNLLQI